ncbi:unnamed protein product [Periconia digitata]|uniref:Heterokaryon incompatibility domain-containing protein n=1 Tax=Periconia digitata TaxID=1303443 RepID=A0A9W4XWJ4_9PLEO|nr:unnamed protein product [Periconia digitata]
MSYELTSAEARRLWSETVLNSLQTVFDDPWFSSLWTLQEAFLRTDAYILGREGVKTETVIYFLSSFYTACGSIYRKIVTVLAEEEILWEPLVPCLKKILELVEASGCYALSANSPIALYGAARYRKTSRPSDRIYGIMQVFGLVLGESADPNRTIGVEELENQFSRSLNERSVFLAQTFVHLGASNAGKSWQVSEYSAVPEVARGGITRPEPNCEIVFEDNENSRFVGKSCGFSALSQYWREVSRSPTRAINVPVQTIHLDYLPELEDRLPWWCWSLDLGFDERQHDISRWLIEAIPSSLVVGLLGSYKGIKRGRVTRSFAGLILRQNATGDPSRYSRVGFCLWEDVDSGSNGIATVNWQECNLRLE